MYLPKAVACQPPEQPGIIEVFLQWYARVCERFGMCRIHISDGLGRLTQCEGEAVNNAYKASLAWMVEAAKTIDEPCEFNC